MAEASLPPDLAKRLAAMEAALANLQRSQNPVMPDVTGLNDVVGVPTADRQTLAYDRSSGTWRARGGSAAGDYVFSASAAAPPDALLCNGASVFRVSYPALFVAIGTTYGSVDGTHFTLPDFRDRFPLGAGGAHSLGSTGGSADAIAVSHSHPMTQMRFDSNDSTHLHAGSGISGGFAEATQNQDGVSSNQPSTGPAGSSGTGANLPPWLACYVYIRT